MLAVQVWEASEREKNAVYMERWECCAEHLLMQLVETKNGFCAGDEISQWNQRIVELLPHLDKLTNPSDHLGKGEISSQPPLERSAHCREIPRPE